jgi:hypothetical protein
MKKSNTGYHIYDFERGQWWKENHNGYSKTLKDAGSYPYEDALSIIKDSNLTKIESEMVHATNLNRIISIANEIGTKEKPLLSDILKKYTTNNEYFKTNPIGDLIQDLSNAGHYFKNINIPHVNYETNEKIELEPEVGKIGLRINLYRMPSGNYETTINTVDVSISHENTLKINKPSPK